MPQSELRTALDAFLIDCRTRRLSKATLKFYQWELDRVVSWLEAKGVSTLEKITSTHLRSWLLELQGRDLSAGSQHASARSLKAWLNWCVREDLLTVSAMDKVRMPKRPREVLPAFSAADVGLLLAACRTFRETALILTLLDSGLRAAELCALQVGDVDLTSGTVRVRQGKGAKDRTTYVSTNTRSALRIMLGERGQPVKSEPLFVSESNKKSAAGNMLTTNGLGQILQDIGQRAGVEDCHAHVFRRTFAVFSLRAGCDLMRLARLLGHSDLQVVQRYLPLAQTDLEEAHAQHNPLRMMLTGKSGQQKQ